MSRRCTRFSIFPLPYILELPFDLLHCTASKHQNIRPLTFVEILDSGVLVILCALLNIWSVLCRPIHSQGTLSQHQRFFYQTFAGILYPPYRPNPGGPPRPPGGKPGGPPKGGGPPKPAGGPPGGKPGGPGGPPRPNPPGGPNPPGAPGKPPGGPKPGPGPPTPAAGPVNPIGRPRPAGRAMPGPAESAAAVLWPPVAAPSRVAGSAGGGPSTETEMTCAPRIMVSPIARRSSVSVTCCAAPGAALPFRRVRRNSSVSARTKFMC
jgi:hypothetical protein